MDEDSDADDDEGGVTSLIGSAAGVPTFESCLPCCGACGLVFALGIAGAFFLLLYRIT